VKRLATIFILIILTLPVIPLYGGDDSGIFYMDFLPVIGMQGDKAVEWVDANYGILSRDLETAEDGKNYYALWLLTNDDSAYTVSLFLDDNHIVYGFMLMRIYSGNSINALARYTANLSTMSIRDEVPSEEVVEFDGKKDDDISIYIIASDPDALTAFFYLWYGLDEEYSNIHFYAEFNTSHGKEAFSFSKRNSIYSVSEIVAVKSY